MNKHYHSGVRPGAVPIRVSTRNELADLREPGRDLSKEVLIRFDPRADDRVGPGALSPLETLTAIGQLVRAGLLPAPTRELPVPGDRVETIDVGGRPSSPSHYRTGRVTALEWDGVFCTWRVCVHFDTSGRWQGIPILSTSTFPHLVHVIGRPERPFSEMTPDELRDLYEERIAELWAEPGPTEFRSSFSFS
jgi:hypothetical protein